MPRFIMLVVQVEVNDGQAFKVGNRGIGMMHDAKVAGAAVAESVARERADHSLEVVRSGQRGAQPGPVDVEGIAADNRDLLDGV